MNDYKKSSRFAGRGEGFSRGGGRPSFGGPRGGRDFGAPKEMFEATCNKCGDSCEVPFRPNGKKPVYCRNCFVRDDAPQQEGGFQKRSFGERSFSQPQRSAEDPRMGSVLKELGSVNAKLDTLIALLGAARPASVEPADKPKKAKKKA